MAVKVSSLQDSPAAEHARLIRELQISCKLRHPAITSAFDGRQTKQHVLLILPWFQRGSLSLRPDEQRDTAYITQAVLMIERLCEAVAYLHHVGIVHGDIKPDNILLDDAGQPHLTDFGSCQSTKANQTAGQIVGTAAYLAPEVMRGERALSIASDVYAIGATLFAILAGEPPFAGDDAAVLQAVRTAVFPSVRRRHASIPRSLEAIINKACAPQPAKRYSTVKELLTDLAAFRQNRPITAQPPNIIRQTMLWTRRHPQVAGLAVALLIIVFVGTLASVAGWSNANATLAELRRSQADLAERGERARQRELELQQTLASIEAEQTKLKRSLEEEADLKRQATEARQMSQRQSDLADQSLKEATRLASSLQAEKQKTADVGQDLVSSEARAEALKDFAAFKTERLAANKQMRSIIKFLNEGRPLLEQWSDLSQFPPEHFGLLRAILAFQPKAKAAPTNDLMFGIETSIPITRRLKVLKNPIAANFSQFDLFDQAAIFGSDSRRLFRLRNDRSNSSFVSEYESNPTINRVANAYGNDSQNAIRIFANRTFVLRNNQEVGDIEAFVVSNQDLGTFEKVWSCRSARIESAGNADGFVPGESELSTKFLAVGTNPQNHLVFLSSTSVPKQKLHRTFLHSLDLRELQGGSGKIPVKTFDLGMQDPAAWPHSLQLSKYAMLGHGAGTPVVAANQRVPGKRGSVSFPNGQWLDLEGKDQPGIDEPIESMLEIPPIIQPKLYFAGSAGQVVALTHFGENSKPVLQLTDCYTAETFTLGATFNVVRIPSFECVPSPLRDRWLQLTDNRLTMITIAEPDKLSFQSIEDFESYLPLLKTRIYQPPKTP